MSKRKSARAIRNAELRRDARAGVEKKRAVERAIHSRGGNRTPARAPVEEAETMPESGVDSLEAVVDAQADELDQAVNNPDQEVEAESEGEKSRNFLSDFAKEISQSDEPEAGG